MPLPDCMMPDGAAPCDGYQELMQNKDDEIRVICEALDKAHALLSVVGGVVREGEQRMPVGVHGQEGVARYLTASFVQKCAAWCEDEYSPCAAQDPLITEAILASRS